AEASGDNDEAEIGLRDKSLKTTVEQLKRRLSQAEREIVALKRYQSPQKCQSHERCEILRRDLLTWRDDHEKRINSQVVSWQLTEQKRIRDEMGGMRKVYDTIQRQLEALERQSTRSYADFRRQIDVWEKRFKEDVVSLHDSDLMELREQLKAWCQMQNAINLSRKEKCKACELRDDTAEMQDDSSKSRESGMAMLSEDNAKFLRRIEHVIKFEAHSRTGIDQFPIIITQLEASPSRYSCVANPLIRYGGNRGSPRRGKKVFGKLAGASSHAYSVLPADAPTGNKDGSSGRDSREHISKREEEEETRTQRWNAKRIKRGKKRSLNVILNFLLRRGGRQPAGGLK
ncbi:hypothetical protein X777_16296, partial [Ooceraea biroi]